MVVELMLLKLVCNSDEDGDFDNGCCREELIRTHRRGCSAAQIFDINADFTLKAFDQTFDVCLQTPVDFYIHANSLPEGRCNPILR